MDDDFAAREAVWANYFLLTPDTGAVTMTKRGCAAVTSFHLRKTMPEANQPDPYDDFGGEPRRGRGYDKRAESAQQQRSGVDRGGEDSGGEGTTSYLPPRTPDAVDRAPLRDRFGVEGER
jgi:hypothetical protein